MGLKYVLYALIPFFPAARAATSLCVFFSSLFRFGVAGIKSSVRLINTSHKVHISSPIFNRSGQQQWNNNDFIVLLNHQENKIDIEEEGVVLIVWDV